MTPKEKAEELIEYYYWNGYGISIYYAKMFAIKVVEEIINTIDCVNSNEIELDVKYWKKVKEYINRYKIQ